MKLICQLAKNPAVAGLVVFVSLAAAFAQNGGVREFDPLSTYVGIWVAKNPGESTPLGVLTLSEANGGLTGTMSPFTDAGVRNGSIVWRALFFAGTQISDLKVSDSSLSFHWIGDPPLRVENVRLRRGTFQRSNAYRNREPRKSMHNFEVSHQNPEKSPNRPFQVKLSVEGNCV